MEELNKNFFKFNGVPTWLVAVDWDNCPVLIEIFSPLKDGLLRIGFSGVVSLLQEAKAQEPISN